MNFDAKVRSQSIDRYDLFHGHIGGIDTLALKKAARMIEDGRLDQWVKERYAGWNEDLGQRILQGNLSLAELACYADEQGLRRYIAAAVRNCWKILSIRVV